MKKTLIMMVIACSFFTLQAQTSKRDKKFVECVAQADMMEVKLAELAQTNASNAEVKGLGKKLTDENKTSLKSVAEKNSIAFPGTLTEKQQKMYAKMAQLNGEKFDKHYTKCMVKSHKKLLCKFKKQARKGENAELKEWAKNSIPTIENHKAVSQRTCIAIKK
jgi:putative membrane protein